MITEVNSQPSAGQVARAIVRLMVRYLTYPFRWFAGHTSSMIVRLWVYYWVQASSRAKCPACGIRAEHDMRWGDAVNALVHVCKRCYAIWSETPMIDASHWRTSLEADGEAVNPDGTYTTTVQHAQREPQISYTPTGNDRPVVIRMRSRA